MGLRSVLNLLRPLNLTSGYHPAVDVPPAGRVPKEGAAGGPGRQGSYWEPQGALPGTERVGVLQTFPSWPLRVFPATGLPWSCVQEASADFALHGPEDSPPNTEPEAACAVWGARDPAGRLREAWCPPYSKNSGRAESEPDRGPQSRPRICGLLRPQKLVPLTRPSRGRTFQLAPWPAGFFSGFTL